MQDDVDESGLAHVTFEILEIIKGAEHLKGRRTIQSLLVPDSSDQGPFLITGVGPGELLWSYPAPISPRAITYLKAAAALADEGPRRLSFFEQYLEDEDPLLAADACDEFSRLPYSAIRGHGPNMNHDRLIELIQSEEITAGHRRLYLTMLSACGRPEDARMLKRFLLSEDAQQRRGLDALVACYLMLEGEKGLPLVEERFLKNREAELVEAYAAVMAYRFLAAEQQEISPRRLLRGLRPILERPDLADLVIHDFARWEDWSVMEQLVELFKAADEKTPWVRVPVIMYLRQCPLPKAEDYLAELEKLDPDSVKRANIFLPDANR
jgi:hypothetical protein